MFYVKRCEWPEVLMSSAEYAVVAINHRRVFSATYTSAAINYRMMESNILFFVISLIGNRSMLQG